jgi:hypothetical protein
MGLCIGLGIVNMQGIKANLGLGKPIKNLKPLFLQYRNQFIQHLLNLDGAIALVQGDGK